MDEGHLLTHASVTHCIQSKFKNEFHLMITTLKNLSGQGFGEVDDDNYHPYMGRWSLAWMATP